MDAEAGNVRQVLWIEDEYTDLVEFRQEFEHRLGEGLGAGVSSHVVLTVEGAEAKLLEHEETAPPDLILLDIVLPIDNAALDADPPRKDMNAGFFIWSRIRRGKWGPLVAETPVVAVTARSNPEYRSIMEDDPRLIWISKPVLGSTVADEAIELLERIRQKTALARSNFDG